MKPKPILTEDQEYCRKALSFWVCGDHHLPTVSEWGAGIAINFSGDLSTFDFNKLTTLVLVAHRYCVRLEVAASGPGRVKIIAHRRKPDACNTIQRHPDLNELIRTCENSMGWLDI